MSRFIGSRSRPHRVLSVCVCVCVSRCLWVCVIEANSLQLRVITIGLYQFLSRSPSCQILAVCGRRLRGVSGSWFPRFLSPAAFLDSDRRRLVCPLLPCATRLSPYGKLRFCLRKAPFLPTESSASAYGKLRVCLRKLRPSAYGKLRLVSRCVLLLVINSLFPQLNPPVFIVTEGSDQFRTLAAECEWNEKAQWDMFLHGLADRIHQEIDVVELPLGLDELVDLALRVDARLQQRDLRGRRKLTPRYPFFDTGDTVGHSSVDEPMQVGRARLSRVERDRRRTRGLCLYCGAAGHFLVKCPVKDQARQ